MAAEPSAFQFDVDPDSAGSRLDAFLASRLQHVSRVAVRRAINEGGIQVDNRHRKPSYTLKGGEVVRGNLPQRVADTPQPEEIPLEILYEDDDLIAINKPSGMVVHPAKGHWAGTLTSALAYHFQSLSQVGGAHRPGIVHRLDRDTSGVIVVARHDQAHMALAGQFERREVEKEYFALCRGTLDRDRDWIRQPIGAHPYQREKMAIRAGHGTSREAETFVEVTERWRGYVQVSAFPKTGRTHQIRVHLAHIGCPVLCDPLYSGHRQLTMADVSSKASASSNHVLLNRLALHAKRLRLTHPSTKQPLEFHCEVPESLLGVTEHFAAR